MESVPSNTHGGLDEQISQLMQCKPLSEQEVLLLLLIHYPDFFEFFFWFDWFVFRCSRNGGSGLIR